MKLSQCPLRRQGGVRGQKNMSSLFCRTHCCGFNASMECQNSTQFQRFDLLYRKQGVIVGDFLLFLQIKSSILMLKSSKLSQRCRTWIEPQKKSLKMKILVKIRQSSTKIPFLQKWKGSSPLANMATKPTHLQSLATRC